MKMKIFLVALLLFCISSVAFAQSMTDAQRQALIIQLQQQVAQILAQQQGNTGNSSWCYNFNNNLGFADSTTGDIPYLHMALQDEGISYSPDGTNIYSTGTIQAVKQFQAKYNIGSRTGFVGPLTRSELNNLYGCGSSIPTNSIPIACTPSWQTGTWGTCTSNQQTRPVTDSNKALD